MTLTLTIETIDTNNTTPGYSRWGLPYKQVQRFINVIVPNDLEPVTWDLDTAVFMSQVPAAALNRILTCAAETDPRIDVKWENDTQFTISRSK